ncbi:MAG: prepilin peptidase [Clostridia bacterium]|nr:prepilin peptidase [Clostridia bacterium]
MSAFKIIMDVCFVAALLLCADSDRRIHEIPGLFLWGIALPGLLQFGCAIGAKQAVWPNLCAIPVFVLLLIFWRRGFIGGGDVKLMALMCFYMGVNLTLIAFSVSCMILGVAGIYSLLWKKDITEKRIPLAPSLALGGIATLAAQYALALFG